MTEHATARRSMSGLEYIRKLVAGELESSPMARLLNIKVVEVEEGRVVVTARPSLEFENGLHIAHGGSAATVPHTARGCAPPVHGRCRQTESALAGPVDHGAHRVLSARRRGSAYGLTPAKAWRCSATRVGLQQSRSPTEVRNLLRSGQGADPHGVPARPMRIRGHNI